LWGSIPITTGLTAAPFALRTTFLRSRDPTPVFELGGHRYFEQNNPLVSLFRPGDVLPTQAM
jgi:hypothetical protein